MWAKRSTRSTARDPSGADAASRSYSAHTACFASPRCHCHRPSTMNNVSNASVMNVIGQDGENVLPNAEKRVGMGAGSIKCTPMDVIKILVIITLFAIIFSLGSALYHLSSGKGDSKKMARALTIRVGLSLA